MSDRAHSDRAAPAPAPPDVVWRGGACVVDGALRRADVGALRGVVTELAAPGTVTVGDATAIVDCDGAWVLPGAIDGHVHAGEPFCDDLDVVADAAARGGVTTLGVYAYPRPADDPVAAAAALVEWAGANRVDVALHWRLQKDTPVAEQVAAACTVGITSFKVFMSYRARGLMWTDGDILHAMRVVGDAGGLMSVHAESGELIAALDELHGGGVEGFLAARPPETESDAVRRALVIGRLARCPVLIPHLSGAAGLDAYRAEQSPGTALETCPQYLFLTADAVRAHGPLAKIGPPLRTAADAAALATAVEDGQIDVVGSDHAPYTPEQKDVPFADAPYGMPGVETLLPLVLDRFGPVIAASVCAEAPARVFGLADRKGALVPGADADVVVVDPAARTTVRAATTVGGAAWSPFEGRELAGAIVGTWLRGAPVDTDMPATGRHLARGRV